MSRTLILVWLGTSAAQAARAGDLESWEQARSVTLRPAAQAPVGSSHHADALSERIESLLLGAQTAIAAGDPAYDAMPLDEAERLLLDNPKLPESAWLMAQLLRLRAAWHRSRNEAEQAATATRTANALEGKRATPFGEADPLDTAVSDAPTTPAPTELSGIRTSDTVFVDGRPASPPRVRPGRHHVLVVRNARTVWAGWVQVEPGTERLALTLPAPPPCSIEDVTPTRITEDGLAVAPTWTTCPEWVVARPGAGGGITIARCRKNRCGHASPWKATAQKPPRSEPAEPRDGERRFPAWLAWTLAGVAVAGGATVLAWQLGAFEQPEAAGSRIYFTPPMRPTTTAAARP